jgi:large subunit ribosomal protein L21|tara:strand:- start:208 stop:723 length:516 start_codon:yes stop_codon:yes gene_type:complete
MYAIVEIAGHQYKVQQDQRVYVNRLPQDEGAKISFDRVLLVDNGSQIDVGAPAVKGATVNAVIERHLKGDKVLIFKKKRRKGYAKKNGFRPSLTEISISGIAIGGAAPKAAAKKAAPKAETAAAKKAAPKAKAAADKPAAKKAAPKKAAPKKAAPKKAAPKKDAPKTDKKD